MWYRKEGSVGRKGGIGGTEGLARKVLRCKFKSACNKKLVEGGWGIEYDSIEIRSFPQLLIRRHLDLDLETVCIYWKLSIYIRRAVGTNAPVDSLTPRNVFKSRTRKSDYVSQRCE